MDSFLDQNGLMVGAIGFLLATIGLTIAGLTLARLSALKNRLSKVLAGSDSQNLEETLNAHLDRVLSLSGQIDSAADRISTLESKMESSKRFLGVVRYDAFEDMGGAQSFAMAIYDENGDGVVVTSQVGRLDCRVYAKELNGGRADREMSAEEKQAIEAAVVKKPLVGAKK